MVEITEVLKDVVWEDNKYKQENLESEFKPKSFIIDLYLKAHKKDLKKRLMKKEIAEEFDEDW